MLNNCNSTTEKQKQKILNEKPTQHKLFLDKKKKNKTKTKEEYTK